MVKRKRGDASVTDVPSPVGPDVEGLSELERKRLLNIARNNEFLKELGLSAVSARKANRPYSIVMQSKITRNFDASEVGVRRSSRIASQPTTVNYTEEVLSQARPRHAGLTKSMISHADTDGESDLAVGVFVGLNTDGKEIITESIEAPPPRAGFASSMDANLTLLLSPAYLAVPLESYGKAAFMTVASGTNNNNVRFNKYSGVAEWRNALFLWVNIGGSTGYRNTFSDDGAYMMWYGGSAMHKESRVVSRLIHLNNRSVSNVKSEDDFSDENNSAAIHSNEHIIILIVRMEGEGYACLGRCQYVAVDLDKSPIEIKWRLQDHDKLCEKEYFRRILRESSS